MAELLNVVFAPINLIVTVPLLLVVAYWLFVILGFVGGDSLDMEAEIDADLDLDAGVDGDADLDAEGGSGGGGILSGFLSFINAHQVPLMIVIGILILVMWTITMIGTIVLNPNHDPGIGLVILFVAYILAIFATKAITAPLAKAARESNEITIRDLTGRICTTLTAVDAIRIGQAEIEITGAPLRLNVRTREGITLAARQQAVIVNEDESRGIYQIEPLPSSELIAKEP
ncbi:MAG: DUF1449 family protein [Sumerlaeia bacterium]